MTTYKRRHTFTEMPGLAILWATVAALILALASCAGGRAPTATEQPSPSPSQTPAQTAEPSQTYTVLVNTVTATLTAQGPTPTPEQAAATPTATSAPTGAPTAVPTGTPTAAPTAAPTVTPTCTVRQDWYAHTVVHGDTLYNIAQRSGSTVEELTTANCLADSTRIYVGQTLYVPRPIMADDAPPNEFIQFYLIMMEDGGQAGPAVGCGDSAVAVWRDRAKTGSLPDDIRASLEELFSIKTATDDRSGYTNSLYDADLAVQSVTVSGDTATIELSGTLQPVGTCSDARMQAQILLTVFQYPGIDSALVTIDGRNMKQMFDVSGRVGANEPYARSQFR